MRIRKSLAGVAAGALAVAGVAVVSAPNANAATTANETFTLYSGINNFQLQAGTNEGPKNISLTVSPASAAPGEELTISVSSSDLAFDNGPAATVQAQWTRIDAVVQVGTQRYLIKGPRNAGAAPSFSNIIAAGWTLSSADGADVATGAGGAAINSDGVAKLDSAGLITDNVATGPTRTKITAPTSNGTYPVILKYIVNNSVSNVAPATGGTGVEEINDSFDQLWTTQQWPQADCNPGPAVVPCSTPAPYNDAAAFAFAAPAEFEVDARTVSVSAVAGQTATNLGRGAGTFDADGPGPGAAVPVPGSSVTLAFNDQWSAGATTVEFCTVTCAPAGSVTLTGGVAESATFAISAPEVATTTTGGTLKITDNNGTKSKTVAFNLLGTRTIGFSSGSSISVGSGAAFNVNGTQFDSGSWVRVKAGASPAAPILGFAQASTSGNVTIPATAPATAGSYSLFAEQYTPGSPGVGTGTATTGTTAVGSFGPLGLTVLDGECTVGSSGSCDTFTTVLAEVKTGSLKQAALGAYDDTSANNLDNATKTTIQIYFNEAANGQDYNLDSDQVDWVNYTRTSTTVQNGVGNLNPIQVTDTRGTDALWSLTASMANLAAGSETITANNIYLSGLTCVDDRGTASASVSAGAAASTGKTFFTTNSNGSLPNDMTLCTSTAADSDGGTSGGQWTVKGGIGVDVPAFQAVGNYSGVLTITLA